MLKQIIICCCTTRKQSSLNHVYIHMGIRTSKYYNHVMVGELPKLPNDTIQPYMHDKTDVCEHTCHAYKRVVKIKQKTKLQLSYKTDLYIKCTHKTRTLKTAET